MRQRYFLPHLLAVAWVAISLTSCSSHRQLMFADREWHVDGNYGQIIDSDTTYRMTFGNVLIPDPLTLISSADSMARYPGMDRFLAEILHTAHLDSAEILFYAPHMSTMFVKPATTMPQLRPSSITANMAEDKPYTMWIYEDDVEDWVRRPSEMYTYTYFDTSRRRLLIADWYDYGDTPVVQIFILQSCNKATARMNIPQAINHAFYYHDLRKYRRDVEFWSHIVDNVRRNAIENYRIGQQQLPEK